MSADVNVGDVCVIVHQCCAGHTLNPVGLECQVEIVFVDDLMCMHCLGRHSGEFCLTKVIGDGRQTRVPRAWLRKKAPKQDERSDPRADLAPADPQGWDLAQWHPNKTKEPA